MQSVNIKEYKGMKTALVTDYTNQAPAFRMEKMSKFSSPKNKKIFIKCPQKGVHMFNVDQ